jgi:hypothetical protein
VRESVENRLWITSRLSPVFFVTGFVRTQVCISSKHEVLRIFHGRDLDAANRQWNSRLGTGGTGPGGRQRGQTECFHPSAPVPRSPATAHTRACFGGSSSSAVFRFRQRSPLPPRPWENTAFEPATKRVLCFARPPARQQALHTDVFIQVRPVHSLTTSNETPVSTLVRSPVRKAREPGEGDCDRPAIHKFHHQSIIVHVYALGQRFPQFPKAQSYFS